ncbi:MAG: hypothetical protein AB1757_28545, partial [Acidobacteriota bacterium]
MSLKRAVIIMVVAIAAVALALPIASMRTRAAAPSTTPIAKTAVTAEPVAAATAEAGNSNLSAHPQRQDATRAAGDAAGASRETLNALGIRKVKNQAAASAKIAKRIKGGADNATVSPQAGEPEILAGNAAFSAALITTEGGRDTQFSEVALLADWDGREDCVADRSKKVDDFSGIEPDIDFSLTRAAISEHTVANGFAENVFYYGDSVGNVWVGVDTTGDGRVDQLLQINLPTVLNAFGTINSDDQVTITGLAVNPVADLGSFGNVNGAYAGNFGGGAPGTTGVTGEILYVSFYDSEGGLRLSSNNTLVRSGVLAFPISDAVSPAVAPPGNISDVGFPVTVGGSFGVAFSVFGSVAGVACDDDGSVYFHQVDLVQFTGGNIVKINSGDSPTWQDRSLAVSGILTLTTLNPAGGQYGTTSGPATQVNRFTNYSGTSTLWGNITTIASGGCNVLYAGVSRSFNSGDDAFTQLTEGLFPAPSAYGAAGTPSMIISFADCSGWTDICSGVTGFGIGAGKGQGGQGAQGINVGGTIPTGNGIADAAVAGQAVTPGVNNFRIFALGNGPDLRPPAGGTAVVPGTPASVLKVDMQIDYTIHNGLAVNEEGTVYVISGGTPAGIGKNPSPMFTEILCFEDMCPMDRRGDFVDLRGDGLDNPPIPGGNVGDGDSDRFDHLFYRAPIDQVTLTPTGLAGLADGFLRYTNRLAPNAISPGITLGQTGGAGVLGDDDTTGPIQFGLLDPSEDVAGGDDSNPPFSGDDADGVGNPSPVSNGGFEFTFGGPVGTANCVWNGFFWNSNGNITFGAGDPSNAVNIPDFRSGLPKIAPAWADLNPVARSFNTRSFPVMALGFANVNAFKVRWINVPEFGAESCVGSQLTNGTFVEAGVTNTFAVTLYDDGIGLDENTPVPQLTEGPTANRFVVEPNTGVIVGCPPRPEGSGFFWFEFCRMDLLGTADRPVISGYSIGGLSPLNPPGLCEVNLSE